jgi:hypothetical protein
MIFGQGSPVRLDTLVSELVEQLCKVGVVEIAELLRGRTYPALRILLYQSVVNSYSVVSARFDLYLVLVWRSFISI